jgi:antitoxin HigA-1
MKLLPNPHPGDILREDYLKPLAMTAYRLSRGLRMPQTAVGEILAGKRSITPATALKLSRFFGSSAEFWLGLQAAYDLEEERRRLEGQLAQIEPCDLDEKWRQRQRAMEARRMILARELEEARPGLEAELAEIEPYDTATEAAAAA